MLGKSYIVVDMNAANVFIIKHKIIFVNCTQNKMKKT